MIKNIPVIDTNRKLLFQIDRCQQEDNVESIQNAIRNGSIESLLKSDDISKIVLTGANHHSLLQGKQLLEKYIGSTFSKEDITLEVVENIQECCYTDKNVKVICFNDAGAFFINQATGGEAGAVSAKELVSFCDFSKLDKVDRKIIEAWKNIFEYETVVFCSFNRYIRQLAQLLNSCGIHVQAFASNNSSADNRSIGFLSSLDVLLFSKQGTYCEKIQVTKLIQIFEWFWHYKQIIGHNLTSKHYMRLCIEYLSCLKREGFGGILCQVNNCWTEKLIHKIKETSILEVISKRKDKAPDKRYIVDFACLKEAAAEDYIRDIREASLVFACENAVYDEICKLCRNVYIFPAKDHLFDHFKSYTERDRYHFIHHREKFPSNFITEICGDKNYPLDQVVQDMKDCQTVKINDQYVKFLSNYQSKYFNTDTYGSRVVVDAPPEFSRTIWLVGGCNFAGYAVEDKDTCASYLQKKINKLGYPYRVIDLSCDAATSFTLYRKMLDRDIAVNDIVIMLEHTLTIEEKTIHIDYKKMDEQLEGIWYWDRVGHPGFAGYQIFAENIFDTIKPILENDTKKNRSFHVKKDLEHKIYNFIAELKEGLYKDERYHKILCDLKIGCKATRKSKIGAIVMNCNPFTYGHQYLIETASRLVDLLYVFVVEENKSIFPFEERFQMVMEGAKPFDNVVVVPSGEFMISTITFPGYFLKDSPTRECYDTFLDLKIFAHYIAPEFGIQMRFVGEEPTDQVTAQYNLDMKMILTEQGITVIEIPRKKSAGTVISASKVRKLLEEHNDTVLRQYVPETTMKYLNRK